MINGRAGRIGGPAYIDYDEDGKLIGEQWKWDDLSHRAGGERAAYRLDSKGFICYEEWIEFGRYHRDGDLPADIVRTAGHLSSEVWYQRGLIHRKGGKPAAIYYAANGQPIKLQFYEHGHRHRQGGPAVVNYNRTGSHIVSVEYYVEGQRLRTPRGWEPQI